ncbi:MAG: RagB/SusD family nutrient uptake outer membrane protein, partial [Planctomycetaceae bacterium]
FYGNANGGGGLGSGDDVMEDLLRVRHFAQSSQDRFTRVLEGAAATSTYMARAQAVEGWTNLLLAQNFCEAPAEQGGPAVSDMEMFQVAITTLSTAFQTAQAAGESDVALAAQAGRARAHLLAGNYDEALADAQAVPTDFEWEAEFSANSGRQENDIVNLSTAGYNRASSIREFYWARVDTVADAMRDPYTDEVDARLAVLYDGSFGVDGLTPHYSQWKYRDLGSNIELTDGAEMRLIEAEVLWQRGDLADAMAVINDVRVAAGLTPRAPTTDAGQVFEYLLYERFAELFWEGQRMSDLHRFGLVDDFIAEGRFGPETENPRPTKFPIAEEEVINSAAFPDKGMAGRCLPMSG